jgi:hypothetical protein
VYAIKDELSHRLWLLKTLLISLAAAAAAAAVADARAAAARSPETSLMIQQGHAAVH